MPKNRFQKFEDWRGRLKAERPYGSQVGDDPLATGSLHTEEIKRILTQQLPRFIKQDAVYYREYQHFDEESAKLFTDAGLKLEDIYCDSEAKPYKHCESLGEWKAAFDALKAHKVKPLTVVLTSEQFEVLERFYKAALEKFSSNQGPSAER